MGNVKVKVRVSHLARGTVNGTEEIKTVLSRGQEFTCSEEEAKRLGTSVIIVEKVTSSENDVIQVPEYATVKTINEGNGTATVETDSGKVVKVQTKR